MDREPRRGTVDEVEAVRRSMLAWIAFALFLFLLGEVRATQTLQVSGQVSATEQEADEGYFAVGQETMVIAKPGTGMHTWLRSKIGQRVTVSLGNEDTK